MPAEYGADYAAVLIAALAALGLVALLLFLSFVLAPRHTSTPKADTYECGMIPVGEHWSQIHVRYYIFAILFVIFDVEVVFLFPWALSFLGVGTLAFYEMILFIAILLFGLAYAWKKGVLEWKS